MQDYNIGVAKAKAKENGKCPKAKRFRREQANRILLDLFFC